MPRIRITESLPQARYGVFMQSAGGPDDDWIRKILEYEVKQGGYDQSTGKPYGLSNFGYNNWQKFGHSKPPSNINEAIEYFKQDYLPKVQKYPIGLRERLADYMFNTGRSVNDLLLYNAGKITLDQLNSPNTFDNEWKQYGPEIEKMYSDPNFINKLDDSKDSVYRTTKQQNGKPNPAYDATWKGRLGLFPKVQASPAQQPQAQTSQGAQTAPPTTQQTPTQQPPATATPKKIDVPVFESPTVPTATAGQKNLYLNDQEPPADWTPLTPGNVLQGAPQPGAWATTPFPNNVGIDGKAPEPPSNEIIYGKPKPASEKQWEGWEDVTFDENFNKRRNRVNTANKVLYGVTHPGQMITKGYNKAMDALNKSKGFQKVAGKAEDIYTNLMKVSPVIDYITDLQNQKRWNKWFTLNSLSDNLYAARPASMTGNRGDWDINTGIFRPNEIGFKSKGMYTNQFNYAAPGTGVVAYGGSINNNPMQKVRIRITGGTEKMATGGQPMTYSGQLGYGLNLGQKRIYTDMPPEKTDTINRTIKPVPRDQANIEAEKGETVFGDIDGDGAMEHMLIGGKKHTEGGTPLNVPEGSFIFSDTKDLIIKDKAILEKFSMPANKKGYTPAEIAKKYDTTKYKAIIEDENSDSIKKATAQIMVKTFEKRLAELALIQEQMKGFPQGIPEVAKKYFPNLQTKEDQQTQPGASENVQYGQPQEAQQMQGGQEEMAEGMMQESPMQEQMEPQMAYGGMIPRFDLAGQVDGNPLFTIDQIASGNFNSPQQTAPPATGPGDSEVIDQTYTPAQRAALSDAEYPRFRQLMDKYNTGKYGKNAIYVNALTPSEAAEFARLATKFGFKRDAEGNVPGYRIIQGATPGYSFTVGKGKSAKKVGFFGGYTPDMYERKVVEDVYGKDASDKMSDIDRRKAFFKEIGVDISGITDAQLANPKTLYQNRDFFVNKFYPAFTKTFTSGQFRPEMQDDMLIGAEHYDSYKTKPKPSDETVLGYKCLGRDASGQPRIEDRSYMNAAERTKDGAAASKGEAELQCPVEPGKIKEGCPPGYYKDANGNCVKMPFDYMTPDKVTMLATMLGAPRKYLPWGQKLPFEPGDVVFKDWRAKAAERQSLFNKMADQLNTYSPGTAVASNLSFLAGQQAEGLSKDIDEVDAYNVQVANAFSDRERQRKDQNNMLNLAKAEELYKGNVIANQQYDNAKRAYYNNMAKAFGNAWKNRMYLGLLNSVNPMFNIDPWEGQSHFKGGYDENDLFNSMGSTASTGSTYRDRVADYLRRGYTIADARKYAAEDDRKGGATANTTAKQAALAQSRALLSGYGSLGGGFNPDEEAGV